MKREKIGFNPAKFESIQTGNKNKFTPTFKIYLLTIYTMKDIFGRGQKKQGGFYFINVLRAVEFNPRILQRCKY